MNIASLLLPNFNADALAGPIIIAFGVILLLISRFVPGIAGLRDKVLVIAWLIIFGGIIYWLFVSFIQDIFTSVKATAVVVSIVLVAIIGGLLFWPDKK